MTTIDHAPPANVAQTAEGGQEMTGAAVLDAAERLREVGAVLRLSEAEAAAVEVRGRVPTTRPCSSTWVPSTPAPTVCCG